MLQIPKGDESEEEVANPGARGSWSPVESRFYIKWYFIYCSVNHFSFHLLCPGFISNGISSSVPWIVFFVAFLSVDSFCLYDFIIFISSGISSCVPWIVFFICFQSTLSVCMTSSYLAPQDRRSTVVCFWSCNTRRKHFGDHAVLEHYSNLTRHYTNGWGISSMV